MVQLFSNGSDSDFLTKNFQSVREKLDIASDGRNVTLLAATKTVPCDVINYAIDHLGLTDIGENRVQELLDKYDDLHRDSVNVHFIGRLQTNKVKYIVDKVCLIHSLDRYELALEIEKQSAKREIVSRVLVEVNIADEDSKGGISPSEVDTFVSEVAKLKHISVCGIMVIPPADCSAERYEYYFKASKMIFDRLCENGMLDTDRPLLSMGMSDSYEIAAKCGSNIVRVGSALFGKRVYI